MALSLRLAMPLLLWESVVGVRRRVKAATNADVAEELRAGFVVQKTCTLYAINGDICGESEIDCKYEWYAKRFQKSLQDGTCASQGYTEELDTKTINVPFITKVTVINYKKPSLVTPPSEAPTPVPTTRAPTPVPTPVPKIVPQRVETSMAFSLGHGSATAFDVNGLLNSLGLAHTRATEKVVFTTKVVYTLNPAPTVAEVTTSFSQSMGLPESDITVRIVDQTSTSRRALFDVTVEATTTNATKSDVARRPSTMRALEAATQKTFEITEKEAPATSASVLIVVEADSAADLEAQIREKFADPFTLEQIAQSAGAVGVTTADIDGPATSTPTPPPTTPAPTTPAPTFTPTPTTPAPTTPAPTPEDSGASLSSAVTISAAVVALATFVAVA